MAESGSGRSGRAADADGSRTADSSGGAAAGAAGAGAGNGKFRRKPKAFVPYDDIDTMAVLETLLPPDEGSRRSSRSLGGSGKAHGSGRMFAEGVAESMRRAAGGGRGLQAGDLDALAAAPIAIRWEIVRLAELHDLGVSIDARFPFIQSWVANRLANLKPAAEFLRKRQARRAVSLTCDAAATDGVTHVYAANRRGRARPR